MEYIENAELANKEIKGIFTDIIKYAPSKLCGMFGNIITVPIYTSLLSTEQYGLYTISIAMLSFLCIIFSDWVGLSGLRFFKHHEIENDLPKYLSTLVTILSINMALMFVLAFLFKDNMYNLFQVPFKYFLSVLVLIIPVAIRALLSQLLRAQLKSIAYSIATILNQFTTIGLTYIFAKYVHLGAASILLGMAISISCIDLLLLYQCDIIKVFKFQKIEWKFIFPIIKYGIPVAATSLSAWLITQSNKVIMKGIHDFTQTACIGAGYSATLPILMTLFAMLTVAVIPRIYNLYEAKIDVRPIITKFIGYYMLISLPLITVMSLYALDYTHLMIPNKPDEFIQNVSLIIPWFSFGVFFLSLTDYTTLQYHLANKTHLEFIIKVISGFIGVGLNLILIIKMGLLGAAIATFTANFIYFALSCIFVIKGFRLSLPIKMICNMFIAFIPSTIVYILLNKYFANISGLVHISILLFTFYTLYTLVVTCQQKLKVK